MMYNLINQLLMNTPVEVDILNEICYMLIKLLYNVCVIIKNLFHHTILLSLDGQSVREIWTLFLYVPPSLADACYV